MRVSVRAGILRSMYDEWPARLPGAVVWRNRLDPGVTESARVLPDGCLDLLWNGTDLLVAGPDTTAFVAAGPPTSYTGLRFAPGTGAAILGVPAAELRDRRVPLTELWPRATVRRLTDRVAASATPGVVLEEIALGLDRSPDPAMTELVHRLRDGEPVAAVAAETGYSERQLHRRSLAAFGYGPKLLARILRLQRALDLARRGAPYAAVAATCGYADQSHLARDVKSLAGVPLTTLLEPAALPGRCEARRG